MVKKIKEIDITKTGPQSFKQLQDTNNKEFLNKEVAEAVDDISKREQRLQSLTLYDPYRQAEQSISSPLTGTITPWGESIFDREVATEEQFSNLANIRAENQPWYSKIGNGLAKGAILAGTTFLDGTIGLLIGTGTAASEGRLSGLWDNDFSKAMKSINEWSEQVLPNYYTEAEREEPWYENIFTANFLGDKFIKNLGFTVGAFYSGGVTAARLKATKLPQIIGAVAKSSKAPAIVTSGVGATISAVNEGRIEALNNSSDWFNLQKAQLDDTHNANLRAIEQYKDTEMYYQMLAQENANYESTLGKLSEDRLKMGNADLLMNIPILTASNLIQFGRLYANGFKTARKANNIVGSVGNYTTDKTLTKGIAKSILSPLSEGTEELLQKTASVVSGLYYEDDVNNFYKAKIDPQAEQETVSWIKSFAEGINQTVNEGSSWEEFFIGTLTGALGMPRFRGIKSAEGSFQSPVILEGGIVGESREYINQMNRETEIANYMNSRVNSPEFINYYQGLIRHNKYQNDMNQAVEANNEFEFKNAEHAQMISDIAMFDNAGKLEDLVTLINSAYDISDENLSSIVENTTSTTTDNNGKDSKVGPFVDKNGNPMYSTPEGKQEMINKLTKTKDEILNTVNDYIKIKDDIDVRTGQQLNDEQLEELTWLKSQITNWQNRSEQLAGEVKPTIETLLGSMGQLADMYQMIKSREGKTHAGLTNLYNNADKLERQLRKNISVLESIKGLDNKTFAYLISNDSKLTSAIKSIINDSVSGVSSDDANSFSTKIDDIVKLVNATNNFNIKLKEYLENPNKLKEDIVESTNEVIKEETVKKANTLKDTLSSIDNLSDFRQIIESEKDNNIREEALKSLENSENEIAKNYIKIKSYNAEVLKGIGNSSEESTVKENALKLFQEHFNNSSTIEEISNTDSIYINNEYVLYDDSLSSDENNKKFQEAQYLIKKVMNKINSEEKFKNQFSRETTEVKTEGVPSANAPQSSTTGASETSTVPSVNAKQQGESKVYEAPIGDRTIEQLEEENANIQSAQEHLNEIKRGKLNNYYRPVIPELHIEASKSGDFRPFNIVVSERESGVNFDTIYNYLRDNGAFTYVNEGNLKPGDELGFMIDPNFNDKTIFIVDKRNNQIVGSLDEFEKSISRFQGLKELSDKVRQEYSNRGTKSNNLSHYKIQKNELRLKIEEERRKNRESYNKMPQEVIEILTEKVYDEDNISISYYEDLKRLAKNTFLQDILESYVSPIYEDSTQIIQNDKFISPLNIKVSKIMVGKIPYTNTERSLAEISNVQSEGKPAIFGIVKNGTLSTNGKLDDSKVVKPADMSNKEGRMYLLIPNAAGKYSPAAVRVKHYNRNEFNPSDVTVQNTKAFKNIQDAVRKLAESYNAEDLSLAVKDLSSSIYTGNLHIDWFDSQNGSGIKFTKAERDAQGNEIYDEKDGKRIRRETTKWVYLTENDPNFLGSILDDNTVVTENIKKDINGVMTTINNALLDFNLPIQVNIGSINKGGYNKMLIDSGVLTSNILDARVLGSWFTTDTFNAEEQLEKATSTSSVIATPSTNNSSPVSGIESVSNKEVEYVKEELPEPKESLSADKIVEIEQSLDEISEEFEDELVLLESKESIINTFNSKEYIPNVEYSVKDIKKVFNNSLYSSEMFANIINIAEQYGVTVTLLDRPFNDKTLGAYGYNKIFIYVSPNHPEFRHTLMHELIHSVTQKLLQHRGDLSAIQEESLDALENIFKYIKKNYISDEYGLNNMSEFLSELSNPAFRDFLKSITIDNKVSVWKKILGYIKRLLLGSEKVTALEISDSILENLLVEPIRDYSRISQAPGRKKIINKNLSKEEKDYILTSIERIMYRNKIIKQGYITLYNPNTKYFYEINIHPTEEGFEDLKQDIIGDGYQSVYRIPLKRNLETTVFNKLPSSIKTTLINKGWTQKKFDSISQQERDKAVECLSL